MFRGFWPRVEDGIVYFQVCRKWLFFGRLHQQRWLSKCLLFPGLLSSTYRIHLICNMKCNFSLFLEMQCRPQCGSWAGNKPQVNFLTSLLNWLRLKSYRFIVHENITTGYCLKPTLVRMGQSVGTIGYKVDIPRAGLIFKGCVNSDWEVVVLIY